MENVPFLPKTLGIKKYRQQMTSKLPANKKSRQRKADGKEEIDDIIDVKLAKLQRKAEEGVESLG